MSHTHTHLGPSNQSRGFLPMIIYITSTNTTALRFTLYLFFNNSVVDFFGKEKNYTTPSLRYACDPTRSTRLGCCCCCRGHIP